MVFALGPRSGGRYPRARSRSLGHRARKDLGAQRSESNAVDTTSIPTSCATSDGIEATQKRRENFAVCRRIVASFCTGRAKFPRDLACKRVHPGVIGTARNSQARCVEIPWVPRSDSRRSAPVDAQADRNRQATAAVVLSDESPGTGPSARSSGPGARRPHPPARGTAVVPALPLGRSRKLPFGRGGEDGIRTHDTALDRITV